jgi:hypothetical protein
LNKMSLVVSVPREPINKWEGGHEVDVPSQCGCDGGEPADAKVMANDTWCPGVARRSVNMADPRGGGGSWHYRKSGDFRWLEAAENKEETIKHKLFSAVMGCFRR